MICDATNSDDADTGPPLQASDEARGKAEPSLSARRKDSGMRRTATRTNGRKRRSLLAAAVGLTAAVAIATPALAVSVGGGNWDYGVSLGFNYSYYYHPNNNHSSAVKSSGITVRSGCQSPGTWATAETWAAVSGNQAYWNNSC
jgi:lactococcin 972 family bacteriocin